jgi:prophage regulatory protein
MRNLHRNFLRLPKVKHTTGLPKSIIYNSIAEGTFPKQISLGPHLVVGHSKLDC